MIANGDGVADVLESQTVLHHRVEPEEVRLAAVSEHEEIVGDGSTARSEAALREIDAGHLDHAKIEILLAPENGANRLGYLLGLEAGGRDLVEQRLKEVIVVAVEQHDLNRRAA